MDQPTRTFTAARAETQAPTSSSTTAERGIHPYTRRFERPLPPEFAAQSQGMTWRTFCSTYAPENGPLRLRDWNERALGRGEHRFEAIFSTTCPDASAVRAQTTASGAIAACSEMLHGLGYGIEIERFHQHHRGSTWTTILYCSADDGAGAWAIGFGENSAEASVKAMLSAIARLY